MEGNLGSANVKKLRTRVCKIRVLTETCKEGARGNTRVNGESLAHVKDKSETTWKLVSHVDLVSFLGYWISSCKEGPMECRKRTLAIIKRRTVVHSDVIHAAVENGVAKTLKLQDLLL